MARIPFSVPMEEATCIDLALPKYQVMETIKAPETIRLLIRAWLICMKCKNNIIALVLMEGYLGKGSTPQPIITHRSHLLI